MIVPGYYEFCCRVKTVAGHRALEKISPELARMNAKKPMIITDIRRPPASGNDELASILEKMKSK